MGRGAAVLDALKRVDASGLRFELNGAQQALASCVRSFAREHVAPLAAERDTRAHFDIALWQAVAEAGLTRFGVDEAYGGAPATTLSTCLMLEALQQEGTDSGLSLALAAHLALAAWPVSEFGTPLQKERYLGHLARGTWIGAFAASERSSGSDLSSLSTRLIPEGERFRLRGEKVYVTNGGVAKVCLVLARSSDTPQPYGLGSTCVLVEPELMDGVEVEPIELNGFRSCRFAHVRFHDVSVGREHILGAPGRGVVSVAKRIFDLEQSVMLAPTLGSMQRGLDDCIHQALRRQSRGVPIAAHQMIQSHLADLARRLEAARWSVYRTAWLTDEKAPHALEGAIARDTVAEAAMQNAVQAAQIMGADGALVGSLVTRTLRDAKLVAIAGGTQELHRQHVARGLLQRHEEKAAGTPVRVSDVSASEPSSKA